MKRAMTALSLAAALLNSTPVFAEQAQEPAPLQPSSQWRLDYGETECRGVREFADAQGTFTVQLGRDGPLTGYYIAILAPASLAEHNLPRSALRVGSTGKWVDQLPPAKLLPDGRLFFSYANLPPPFWKDFLPAAVADAPLVLWLRFGKHVVGLDMKKMRPISLAFEQCEDDLMKSMGHDGPTLRTLKSGPTPSSSPENWLDPNLFPKELASEKYAGALYFWLDIDDKGVPTNCRILELVGAEAYKKVTCDSLMARARFHPAVAADGRPVSSYIKSHASWLVTNGVFAAPKKKDEKKGD